MELTKDTDMILCQIYKEYLNRLRLDIPKIQAKEFRDPETLVNDFLQGTRPDDVAEAIFELHKINFVEAYLDASFMLKKDAIIYMENRFKKGLIEVTDFIAKFIP